MLSPKKIIQSLIEKTPTKIKRKAVNSNIIKDLVINPLVKDYGEIIEFCLNAEKREIHIKVLLVGEKEPVELNIQGYDLIEDDENPCIVIKKCTTSRQWMTALSEKFLCGKELPIPKDKFALVKSILV